MSQRREANRQERWNDDVGVEAGASNGDKSARYARGSVAQAMWQAAASAEMSPIARQ